MFLPRVRQFAVSVLVLSLHAAFHHDTAIHAQAAGASAESAARATDLDAFMERVLARRELNRKTLNDYVLDETERFELLGPGGVPLHRTRREFTWYVRDGMHVRSPVRFNGVEVGSEQRDEYERRWIAREQQRRENKEKRQAAVSVTGADAGPGGMPTEPRFVSEAYFMDFKFEPGNYLLAGHETFEGQEVLRVEYYPARLFDERDGEDSPERRDPSRGESRHGREEEEIGRRMNKTALITLWIDPAQHQIVKYSFDNVWLDFLPGRWVVRVNAIGASMTMGQPFPGVWLPRDISIQGNATLANGEYDVSLSRTFTGYREAQVTTTIKVPRAPEQREEESRPDDGGVPNADGSGRPRGPFIPDEQEPVAPAEVIREVRVHGNTFVSDEEVLRIAGLPLGSPVRAGTIAEVRRRLEASGFFEAVEVRKRYRSLSDPSDVALVLVVHERPGVTSTKPTGGSLRRMRNQVLFMPVVDYADGYGFTYGGRVTTIDWLGAGERFSVPLTWGGTRRAALEFDRTFRAGPLTRVSSSMAIWQRENPRFDVDDRRAEVRAGAERQFARMFRAGIDASRSRVTFAELDDRQWTLGISGAFDTRLDPAFPRNAVYAGAGWTGLHVNGRSRIDRYNVDTRAYVGLAGQAVLAGRAQYFAANATLPPYERVLAGGFATLRGFRAGAFDGDRLFVTSLELRTPITSVISGARLGVSLFTDAVKLADHDGRLSDARWRRGVGAGLFLIASVLRVNLDVGRGLDGGGTRVHLGSGFAF